MGVQLDAAKIDDPGKPSGVIDNNFFRRAPGRKRKRNSPQPIGPIGGARF